MVYHRNMERSLHRQMLAEMYECPLTELLSKYDPMTAQIRNDAIVTLSIERPKKTDTFVSA